MKHLKTFTEFKNHLNESYSKLNELQGEGAAIEYMIKMMKSLKNLMRKSSKYKKLKKAKDVDLEQQKLEFNNEFAIKKDEEITRAAKELKAKYQAMIQQAKDPNAKTKIRAKRDADVEKLEDTVGAKIDRQKTDNDTKIQRAGEDIDAKISELDEKYPIENDGVKARWTKMKLKIDRSMLDAQLNLQREIADKYEKDEAYIKRMEEAMEKKDKALEAASNESYEKQMEAAKEAEKRMEEDLDKMDDGEQKEALKKVLEFNKKIGEANVALGALSASPSPETKAAAKKAKSEFNDAYTSISATTMKNAYGYETKDEGEQALADLTLSKEGFDDEYDEVMDGIAKDIEDAPEEETTDDTETTDAADTTDDKGNEEKIKELEKKINNYEEKLSSGAIKKEEVKKKAQAQIDKWYSEIDKLEKDASEGLFDYRYYKILSEMEQLDKLLNI